MNRRSVRKDETEARLKFRLKSNRMSKDRMTETTFNQQNITKQQQHPTTTCCSISKHNSELDSQRGNRLRVNMLCGRSEWRS